MVNHSKSTLPILRNETLAQEQWQPSPSFQRKEPYFLLGVWICICVINHEIVLVHLALCWITSNIRVSHAKRAQSTSVDWWNGREGQLWPEPFVCTWPCIGCKSRVSWFRPGAFHILLCQQVAASLLEVDASNIVVWEKQVFWALRLGDLAIYWGVWAIKWRPFTIYVCQCIYLIIYIYILSCTWLVRCVHTADWMHPGHFDQFVKAALFLRQKMAACNEAYLRSGISHSLARTAIARYSSWHSSYFSMSQSLFLELRQLGKSRQLA